MSDVSNSDEVQTGAAVYARRLGYNVHHDIGGWYVIAPSEREPASKREPASGSSLGFDGRRHFAVCAEAWLHAQKLALRRARRT